MALLQECPKCKERQSLKYWAEVGEGDLVKKVLRARVKCESCGFKLNKSSGKVYWIEYYQNGRRKRERIGPSKSAAEQRLREALKLRTEERFIDKDPAARLSLGELCKWYLDLPEVKAKDSYNRDGHFISHLKRLLGEATKIKDITPGKCESYQKIRSSELSPRHPGENIRPCTVNKELACLKTMLNRAVRHAKLNHNHLKEVKRLSENNVRMRILTGDEFNNLLNACDTHIRPIVKMAYYMGMRYSEILFLIWPEVDLKKGFIRLSSERTKTDCRRSIPIHPEVKAMLESLPRGLHTDRVFLRNGQPFDWMKHSFKSACRRASIANFTFHDLRHCALNNLRKAGNDFFQVMALSGHRSMSCFKRYNLVTEEELSNIKWPSNVSVKFTEDRKVGTVDTYMDTKETATL
jgi:integrase